MKASSASRPHTHCAQLLMLGILYAMLISTIMLPAPSTKATGMVSMVVDLNLNTVGSIPHHLTNINGTLFFFGSDLSHPYALWKKTPAGIFMVKNLIPPEDGVFTQYSPTYVNGKIFFVTFLSTNRHTSVTDLWVSDGTETGTILLKRVNTGELTIPFFNSLIAVGDRLFMSAYNGVYNTLWSSDGSIAGTKLVKELYTGIQGASVFFSNFTSFNGRLFFIAYDVINGYTFWRSDGTEAGTVMVKGPSQNGTPQFISIAQTDRMLFLIGSDPATGSELWKSDGTQEGTMRVHNTYPQPLGFLPRLLTNINDTLFFVVTYAGNTALWKSDGSENGTILVKNIPGSPLSFANVNGTLFFTDNQTLWKSDGTEAGTVAVKTIPYGNNSSLDRLTGANGRLFFIRSYNGFESELWTSDGTEAGSIKLVDINPGIRYLLPRLEAYPTAVGDTLFFTASDIIHGAELWQSDGTMSGTSMVSDLNTSGNGSVPGFFTTVGNKIFFLASTTLENGLYVSDGSQAGTLLLKSVPYTGSSTPYFNGLTAVGNELLFIINSDNEHQIWKSDGTVSGTVPIKQIDLSINTFYLYYHTSVDGVVYFVYAGTLWKSDGTQQGTIAIRPDPHIPSFRQLTAVNGKVFVIGDDPLYGTEVWVSDGSDAGTHVLKDIVPGSVGSAPGELSSVNNSLFFATQDSYTTSSLWKSDGTETGTTIVKSFSGQLSHFIGINKTLFFFNRANAITNTYTLWKSDGTADGTTSVQTINFDPNMVPGTFRMVAVQNMLFFKAYDPIHGEELWKSDGTAAGTQLVRDIYPGLGGSSITKLLDVNGMLFFAAIDAEHGQELWQSDGTEAGTILVEDINPGRLSAGINDLGNLNGTLFFQASDGIHGVELWKTGPVFVPISLIGRGARIDPGSEVPSAMNGTDFGTQDLGQARSITYTITNSSSSSITLDTTNLIRISGAAANDFSVTAPSTTNLAPGESTTFIISFTPGARGLRQALVTISLNTGSPSSFNFAIQGTGDKYMVSLPLVHR